LTSTGFPAKAIELLSSPGSDSDSRLMRARGEARLLSGDISGAISDFNNANKLTPGSGEYGLSRAYAFRGDAKTALYHLELDMKSSFRRDEKEIFLDPAFQKMENSPEWRLFWKKEWYPRSGKMVSEIEYYAGFGKIDDASALLSQMEASYPGDDNYKYGTAIIAAAAGKHLNAINTLVSLLAADPNNEKFLKALAASQSASSNYAGASETYSSLIALEVPDPELFMKRAECYRRTGETSRAIDDISRYLTIYPGNRNALSLGGKIEALSGDNLKALQYFSENLRLHPNDPVCYNERGNSYFAASSWQWAVKDYSMSLDLDPENADIWLNKGLALIYYGKTEDGCTDLRMAFSLGNKKAVEHISKHCIR
jgi:tetratricopeptide (TPR) repeat protein